MYVKEESKYDIEKKLESMGDYVKMSYLQGCLKKRLDFDTKKFVVIKLAGIYESRRMHIDAAKLYKSASEINISVNGKVNDLLKACQLFIEGGNFIEADVCFSRALGNSKEIEKNRVRESVMNMYKTQAKIFLSRGKRKKAMDAYQKVWDDFNLDPREREEIGASLLDLYGSLGKIREYSQLKEKLNKK